jgi:hypothetical protein
MRTIDLKQCCQSVLFLCVFACLAGASMPLTSRAELSVTNRPFAGVAYYAETRTNPPTRLFVAEVDLTNPQVQLRVSRGGADPDGPGEWQTTLMQPTKIAAREKFDLVVNGDFFKARGVKDAEGTNSGYRADIWALVEGPAVTDRQTWAASKNSRPCLVVRTNRAVSIEMLMQPPADAREVIAGNMMLVQDGKMVAHASKVRHPRTVVGFDAKKSKLILLVVDGRKPGVAVGMSYNELAEEMLRLGCHEALNLDGGGSSVLAIREPESGKFRILNQPTDGRERAVANVLGVTVGRAKPTF